MSHEPLSPEERALKEALGASGAFDAEAEPRRTDAAFFRSVKADVDVARGRGRAVLFALVPAAAASIAIAFVVGSPVAQPPGSLDAGVLTARGEPSPLDALFEESVAALSEDDARALDDESLLALASALLDPDEGPDDDTVETDVDEDDELDDEGNADADSVDAYALDDDALASFGELLAQNTSPPSY